MNEFEQELTRVRDVEHQEVLTLSELGMDTLRKSEANTNLLGEPADGTPIEVMFSDDADFFLGFIAMMRVRGMPGALGYPLHGTRERRSNFVSRIIGGEFTNGKEIRAYDIGEWYFCEDDRIRVLGPSRGIVYNQESKSFSNDPNKDTLRSVRFIPQLPMNRFTKVETHFPTSVEVESHGGWHSEFVVGTRHRPIGEVLIEIAKNSN